MYVHVGVIKTKQQIQQAKRSIIMNDGIGNLRTKKNVNSKRKERTNRLLESHRLRILSGLVPSQVVASGRKLNLRRDLP